MNADDKQRFVRRIAEQNLHDIEGEAILWSRHGISELLNEGWTRREVENGLRACEVIEDYPFEHRSLPDCLVLGRINREVYFHAVIGIDEPREVIYRNGI